VSLLPTFAEDSSVGLRYGVQVDDGAVVMLDASGTEQHRAGITPWEKNVLANEAVQSLSLGVMKSGVHRLRVIYGDPGVVFENFEVVFAGAVPGYPVAPETGYFVVGGVPGISRVR